VKAVFFDLGGTLLHGRGLGVPMDLGFKGAKAAYDQLRAAGVKLPMYPIYLAKVAAAFMAMGAAGSGLKELDIKQELRRFYEDMGAKLSGKQLDETIAAWHGPFAAEMRLDPKAVSALETLSARGIRMGVITNSVWPESLISLYLEKLNAKRFFEVIVSSANVGFRKPSPTIFEMALKRLGVAPSECAYVGDRRKEDVVGAQQAGMRSVLLKKDGVADDPGPEPDLLIHSLEALPSVLDSLR
jgi:putative hydrolase of the HAD superfamily